ncbi:hypothetical protein EJ08DRAFT_665574 [Tothia fuscella]|uniref:Myb-like domain-containing protein n=1 Tax=Tothia fuscella TaxID=1048955 RepID=A0A9P4TTR4_9PEZI|nr:hypothetical protein EJ08DRAFT_665574 [Tothia fuscella]
MNLNIKTDTCSSDGMMNAWPEQQCTEGFINTGQVDAYAPQQFSSSTSTKVATHNVVYQHQFTQPCQSVTSISAPTQGLFNRSIQEYIPTNIHFIQRHPSFGFGMTPAVQPLQHQDQQYQDEMEQLMMATDAIPHLDMQSSESWNGTAIAANSMFPVNFDGNIWHTATPQGDQKVDPLSQTHVLQNANHCTPYQREYCRDAMDYKTQYGHQPVQSTTTSLFPSASFDSSSYIAATRANIDATYAMSSFGSFSDHSDLGRSFSPASPTPFLSGPQEDNVRIRRDSHEQPAFHGMSARGLAGTSMSGTAYASEEWSSTSIFDPHHEKVTRRVNPALIFPQPLSILQSQRGLSDFPLIEPDEPDFGSPDLDDELPDLESPSELPSLSPEAGSAPSQPASLAPRTTRDALLVHWRRGGMSYRDIRIQGCFTEAESTLRGRFRTLTKVKSERVRKPCWGNDDKRLLREAVFRFAGRAKARAAREPEDIDKLNVQWKEIANYIIEHGGSYHFGNATCKKKWCEMAKRGFEI